MIIHTPTQELYNRTVNKLLDDGFVWRDGRKDVLESQWIRYKEQTRIDTANGKYGHNETFNEQPIYEAEDFLTIRVGDTVKCIKPRSPIHTDPGCNWWKEGEEFEVENVSGVFDKVYFYREKYPASVWEDWVIKVMEPSKKEEIWDKKYDQDLQARTKFKVGDKVKLVHYWNSTKNEDWIDEDENKKYKGCVGTIIEKNSGRAEFNEYDWMVKFEDGEEQCFWNEDLELVPNGMMPDTAVCDEAATIQPVINFWDGEKWLGSGGGDGGYIYSGTIKVDNNGERIKPKKNIMQNIVQFAKNLTLSENDKLFREVGLQNVDGSYTEEAMQIVVNLKAVELGYKDDEELFQKVGVRNHISSFEYAALFGAYNDKLVEIAKAKKAEDKKK